MKKVFPLLFCFLILSVVGCSDLRSLIDHIVVPEKVTIKDITYRSGFYGDLYPMFGEVGDIGSDTLNEEIIYEDGKRKFQRVDFEGHDWVHSYIGKYSGGVVYCAESQWQQMHEYYADPLNFKYYYGVGYYISETSVNIPVIDTQKFDELLVFGNENSYKPFDESSNKKVMKKIRRIPESEFHEGVCFYKVSNDGYFESIQEPMYFVYEGKLLLVFYHDGGSRNGGIEEVLAVDVPDELGQYFIGLMESYQ
jgi:hypothetical protein